MSNDDDLAIYVDFVNRGRRAQVAVDEVIRSSSEPEAEQEQDIREEFLNEHYWNSRNLLDEVLDADDDDTYRRAIAILREAIDRYPT